MDYTLIDYTTLKTLHILSAILLFGTGLGSAFYKHFADRSGNVAAVAVVNHLVVLADWLFTTPTVLLQPLTGYAMLRVAGWPLDTSWVVMGSVLFLLAGACWLPVVWLQIRMARASKTAWQQGTALPASYRHWARTWFWLGVPAFIAMVLTVAAMVFKPTW